MLRWIGTNISKTYQPQKTVPTMPPAPQPQHSGYLPNDLASRILELQYQSETSAINRELIASLTLLYIEAADYYQSQSSEKYRVYLKRKEMFLKKSSVADILNGKSGELVNKKESAQKSLSQARHKSRSEVTRILNQTQKKAAQQQSTVRGHLEQQNRRLEERIQRRRTLSNRSTNSERQEPDNEEGPCFLSQIEKEMRPLNSGRQMRPLNSGRQTKVKRVFI